MRRAWDSAACTSVNRCCRRRRYDRWFQCLPGVPAPLTAFLINDGQRWVLVDAGTSDSHWERYASGLVGVVRRALPQGATLDAILSENSNGVQAPWARPASCLSHFPNLPLSTILMLSSNFNRSDTWALRPLWSSAPAAGGLPPGSGSPA